MAAANANASSAPVTSRWRAHGIPAACSTSFIRALSRTLRAVPTSVPGMPRACAGLARAAPAAAPGPRPAARTGPSCRDRPRTASAICCGSSASSTRQCPARCRASSGGTCSAAAVVTTASRTPGSCAAVLTNRTVAGIRNGATKAATTMNGSYPAGRERGLRRARLPTDPAALRPGPGRGGRHGDRRRRAPRRMARRRAPQLDAALPPGVHGGRRRRAHRHGAARPGLPVGGPARGDDRGAHAGGRAGAGELHRSPARPCARRGCAATSRR